MGDTNKESGKSSVGGYIVRFILTVIVLGITSFLTPGFRIVGLWSYLLAAVVISLIDYFVERFMGVDASPFGKGVKGFIIAAIILYLTQFLVPHMSVSLLGAVLAAVVIGILDAVIPGRVM
ncbi:phage holin family protein [Clostridium sp. WILCCON 0269]|uniref:Phage holin family protein n=1 Tax=Candidatus Clostridium eludens TaxID=3381663 RepID=A0ABW8SMC9_9CLOT